ncbi:hypothetical protein CDD83_4501 [Cordyceps sp. RAO-2017]|nr:hypothetical protein CDD83_4501 [Cordyceps sp. RAO-2017]
MPFVGVRSRDCTRVWGCEFRARARGRDPKSAKPDATRKWQLPRAARPRAPVTRLTGFLPPAGSNLNWPEDSKKQQPGGTGGRGRGRRAARLGSNKTRSGGEDDGQRNEVSFPQADSLMS